MTGLILVWGVEGDESGFNAARLDDLINRTLPETDYYPVVLRNGYLSITAGYDSPVEPLEIMTPEAFLRHYPTTGRVPNEGEVLEGIIDE